MARIWFLVALMVLAGGARPAVAGQPQAAAAQAPAAARDPEADTEPPAAVLLGGERVIWITTGTGPYSPQFRADRISQRLRDITRDPSLRDVPVTVIDVEDSSELRVGERLLMVVTQQDARSLGSIRATLAAQNARELDEAIRAERRRYEPSALARGAGESLVATLVLALAIWLIVRVTAALTRVSRRRRGLQVLKAELISPDAFSHAAEQVIVLARLILMALALELYLAFVLRQFPWTRAVSVQLLDYVVSPVRAVGGAFLGYLPNLLFVIVIGAIVFALIRVMGLFFAQVRQERIVFTSFPAEWADPTNKILRVLLIAFGVVAAFPYLPASSSPAFAGVSVFIGLLLSLASSSALSNSIAGIVLTYTGAFRIGDRVKIGESYGDIIESSLLATRVRTIKNEDVTIPNGLVLNTSVINYSRVANTLGLILHTTVTIGYSSPWRQVHELLIAAALSTKGVLAEPKPFVWQTSLNDFYITYEINAYINTPADMNPIYAELHSRIQDAFAAAGVEIMSPHYFARRDGDPSTIPSA